MRCDRPFCPQCPSKTVSMRNSCGDETHQHHDRPSDEECEHCQGRGHIEANCPKPRCKACGRSDHRNARNFECREPKCTKCRGVMTPKGQNKRPGSGHPSKESGKCPYRVCSTCGATGHSARESPYRTVGICNSCGDGTHQHHDRPRNDECEHSQGRGHIEADCPKPRCKACGRSDHRIAWCYECLEHKCMHKDATTPKMGHNTKNCPETMDPICAIREAEARSFECPEHTCTKCNGALPVSPKGQNVQPVRRNWALSTKPTARRCRNRLAEPTVPGIEPSPVWQCCSHPPRLSRP